MCGIIAIITSEEEVVDGKNLNDLKTLIDTRGPDYSSPIGQYQTKCGLQLKVGASVLHLRGDSMQKQPVIDSCGNVLLFNGQIYRLFNNSLESKQSDTSILSERLKLCQSKDEVVDIIASIDGPFAFIYWHDKFNSLFYGRDFFGRKSLCTVSGLNQYPYVISSVGMQDMKSKDGTDLIWREVDCKGLQCLDFSSTGEPKLKKYMWNLDGVYPRTEKCHSISLEPLSDVSTITEPHITPLNPDRRLPEQFSDNDYKNALIKLEEKLTQAISMRVNYNRSTCLTCRSICVNPAPGSCCHSKIAVAFSGGIDSTLIALILDKVVDKSETIDLLTVAFKCDSPDRASVSSAFKELRGLCPYRNWRLVISDITPLVLQLERRNVIRHLIAPCATVVDDSLGCACWFISRASGRVLDSSIPDVEFERVFEEFVRYNTSPSELQDDWIIKHSYTSPATIFFAGMGIDEQLGGYSSHKAAWNKSKIQGLFEEISFQMRRISSRNLGRDDRTCSYHGRDVKLPYLDYDFVSFINQLPIGLKMNLDESSEVGPKKLLRLLAFKLGLRETSRRTKRALQFGTRIANLEHPKEKGSDTCIRLLC